MIYCFIYLIDWIDFSFGDVKDQGIMPLFILGLLLLIGLLIYSVIRYINSSEVDTRTVRERYPHAFSNKKKSSGNIFTDDDTDSSDNDNPLVRILRNEGRQSVSRPYREAAEEEQRKRENGENVIEFPTDNIEAEKIKRNIH